MMPALPVRVALALALALALGACASNSRTAIDEALGLSAEDSPAELYVRMAEQYHARGQNDVAFRRAQQAVEVDKRYPRAHIWLAYLYEQLARPKEADQHYERAVALAPNNSDVLHAYGSYLCRQQRYSEADAQFTKALANPLYATPWVSATAAGNCAASAGESARAEEYYRAAIQTNANFGPALAKLGALAASRGDYRAAKNFIDRYFRDETLRTPISSLDALRAGIQAERKLGNRKRAAYYEQLLRTNFPDATRS